MKIEEIIDQIIRSVDGLITTDDSRISERAVMAKIPTWKQKGLLMIFNGTRTSKANKNINSQNYFQARYSYNPTIQIAGANFRLFEIEPPVQLDERNNGCIFVGDELTGKQFTQLKYPSTISVANDGGYISQDEVYYNITGTQLKDWGNTQLADIFMDYIPVDVMNISTFNPVTMEYPVSQDVLDLIFALAFAELAPQSAKQPDLLNNSAPNMGGGRA